MSYRIAYFSAIWELLQISLAYGLMMLHVRFFFVNVFKRTTAGRCLLAPEGGVGLPQWRAGGGHDSCGGQKQQRFSVTSLGFLMAIKNNE